MSSENTLRQNDASCLLCGETGEAWDVELEVICNDGEVQAYRVHRRCFLEWDLKPCLLSHCVPHE